MKSIIKSVCEECASTADSKEIDIMLELPDEDVTVQVDRMKLERAILNLLNNAVDASLIGGKISVSLSSLNDTVSLGIRDYGAGMDKETIENIFIPFYTKKSSGTGLGMAISKKSIEMHGGRINVSSRENEGTAVIVELPVCDG